MYQVEQKKEKPKCRIEPPLNEGRRVTLRYKDFNVFELKSLYKKESLALDRCNLGTISLCTWLR